MKKILFSRFLLLTGLFAYSFNVWSASDGVYDPALTDAEQSKYVKNTELQLGAFTCNGDIVSRWIEAGANPLFSMGERADNAFDMAMRNAATFSRQEKMDVARSCMDVAMFIRNAVNNGNYSKKIVKLVHLGEVVPEERLVSTLDRLESGKLPAGRPAADKDAEEESGIRVGEHHFSISGHASFAYMAADGLETTTYIEGGLEVAHTVGPWANTVSIAIEHDREGDDHEETGYTMSLEGRRDMWSGKFTGFVKAKALRTLAGSRSQTVLLGAGKGFKDVFRTGVDVHGDIGAGAEWAEDSNGFTSRSPVIHGRIEAVKDFGSFNATASYDKTVHVNDFNSRTGILDLRLNVCLDGEKCRFTFGPGVSRTYFRVGDHDAEETTQVDAQLRYVH